jgi:hypothetical protein
LTTLELQAVIINNKSKAQILYFIYTVNLAQKIGSIALNHKNKRVLQYK